jgi:epsilon-lactone hydrolase
MENIASIGHSVGGNLAVSLAVTLRDKGVPLPAAILSVSPWYDIEAKNETLDSNAQTDALITRAALERFREAWIGGTGVSWNDPRVNMLYADLSGLPPIMVYYGAHEVLAGEAVEFAKRAKDAASTSAYIPSPKASTTSSGAPAACPRRTGRSKKSAAGCDQSSVWPRWRRPST